MKLLTHLSIALLSPCIISLTLAAPESSTRSNARHNLQTGDLHDVNLLNRNVTGPNTDEFNIPGTDITLRLDQSDEDIDGKQLHNSLIACQAWIAAQPETGQLPVHGFDWPAPPAPELRLNSRSRLFTWARAYMVVGGLLRYVYDEHRTKVTYFTIVYRPRGIEIGSGSIRNVDEQGIVQVGENATQPVFSATDVSTSKF